MSTADRETWDRRYRERAEVGVASAFVCAQMERLPANGRALDVAAGAGRHALWLAERGLAVTAIDVSPVGLAMATDAAARAGLKVETEVVDLEQEPIPTGPWDVILCFHYLERRLFPEFATALAPGGLLLFSQPTETNLTRHPRPSRRFLLADGELAELVRDLPLAIERLTEEWNAEGRHEAELVARRL